MRITVIRNHLLLFCSQGDLTAKLQELNKELEEIRDRRMAQEMEISLVDDPAVKVTLINWSIDSSWFQMVFVAFQVFSSWKKKNYLLFSVSNAGHFGKAAGARKRKTEWGTKHVCCVCIEWGKNLLVKWKHFESHQVSGALSFVCSTKFWRLWWLSNVPRSGTNCCLECGSALQNQLVVASAIPRKSGLGPSWKE